MTFRNPVRWAVLLLLGCPGAQAGGSQTAPPILAESPACVVARLGQVAVTLGTREVNDRTGMPPPGVSYRKAFARLAEAGAAKGADAIVLRHHEAAYLAKGARQPRWPTYIELHGAAIRLDPSRPACDLTRLLRVEQGMNY